MLNAEPMVAFVVTARPDAARTFYEDVLGLAFTGDMGHALVFDTAAGRLMLQKMAEANPRPGTVLGWHVSDLRGTNRGLAGRGVVFERFDDMAQDADGIWSPSPGQGVCWFKDPDGNLLSLSGAT